MLFEGKTELTICKGKKLKGFKENSMDVAKSKQTASTYIRKSFYTFLKHSNEKINKNHNKSKIKAV